MAKVHEGKETGSNVIERTIAASEFLVISHKQYSMRTGQGQTAPPFLFIRYRYLFEWMKMVDSRFNVLKIVIDENIRTVCDTFFGATGHSFHWFMFRFCHVSPF